MLKTIFTSRNRKEKKQKGFAALLVVLLVLAAMLGTALSITILTIGEYKISSNIIKSNQAYYAAEAGIEDALLRLVEEMEYLSSYPLTVGGGTTTVEISDIIGGSRVITANGNVKNQIRKMEIVYAISSDQISFHYGAQVGEGGMLMYNNSEIKGNVFSNGSILPAKVGAKGTITGEVIVASTSSVYGNNKIQNLTIEGDAYTNLCENCEITGELHWLTGGDPGDCTAAGGIIEDSGLIAQESLPVTHAQIDEWEVEAASTPPYNGDYVIESGVTEYLGPLKINGSLTLENSAVLIMKGTIWVTGDISFINGSKVRLDPDSYGGQSGVLIADNPDNPDDHGKITSKPNVEFSGSGKREVIFSFFLLIPPKLKTIQLFMWRTMLRVPFSMLVRV